MAIGGSASKTLD